MTVMQIVLLVVTAFFAFKVYEHMQGLKDPEESGQPMLEEIDIDALVDEADRAFDAGRMLEARELLQKAYSHDDSIPELANRLGFVLSEMGNHEEALKLYLHSLALKEEDVTHLAIASQLRTLGRLEESQEHYEKALQLDDNYEVSYFNYHRATHQGNQYE